MQLNMCLDGNFQHWMHMLGKKERPKIHKINLHFRKLGGKKSKLNLKQAEEKK